MSDITLANLTEGTLAGGGVFDVLMRASKEHLEAEFKKGSIRGPEYSTVYLGQLQSSMQTALSFIMQKEKVSLESQLLEVQVRLAEVEVQKANQQLLLITEQALTAAVERRLMEANVAKVEAELLLIPKQSALLDAQVLLAQAEIVQKSAENANLLKQGDLIDAQVLIAEATVTKTVAEAALIPKQGLLLDAQLVVATQQGINSEVEKRVLEGQVCKLQAEFDYTVQNTLKSASEITLLTQRLATEKAQTLATGVEDDSVLGRQKKLYDAQASGFKRDAEQKVAALYADVYKTFRMTDTEFPIPEAFNSVNLTAVINALRQGISLPAT